MLFTLKVEFLQLKVLRFDLQEQEARHAVKCEAPPKSETKLSAL